MNGRIRIDPPEAKAKVDSGEAIVLDVVDSETYSQLRDRIRGAVRIPPEEIVRRFGELPRDRSVIAY